MSDVPEYRYVGPVEIKLQAGKTARQLVATPADIQQWITASSRQLNADNEFTATFIVSAADGSLYIADRHSEHISCARQLPVRTAGEITFQLQSADVRVTGLTNQSTGFCPDADASWKAIDTALSAANLPHPDYWTQVFVFRRCPACGMLNIVKDDWYSCAACDAELPEEWNCNEFLD